MTELYGWKPTGTAKIHLDESERAAAFERERERFDQRRLASQAWLDDYHTRPQRTAFDWSPRFPTNIETLKEQLHAQDAEDSFRRISEEAAQVGLQPGMGDAAAESGTGERGRRVGGAGGPERDQPPREVVGNHDARSEHRAGGEPEHDWHSDPIPF